jgi:hypothetical protein
MNQEKTIMKSSRSHWPGCLATLFAMTLCGAPPTDAPDLPFNVPFEVGYTKFTPGDNITIQQIRGTSETIAVGGTYSVDGTYTNTSCSETPLCFYVTAISGNGSSPVDPKQELTIKKGSGSFHLVETMNDDGYFHVCFGGNNVYFGQGNRVYGRKFPASPLTGPNKTLLEYLGNPVKPPANMDARYTKEGLAGAIRLAAQNAGIIVKKIAIDDSEFPYLVGVICGGSDASKLKAQIKRMDGYEYGGSVGNDRNSDGSDTCNTFSIVPHRSYPPDVTEQIYHRLMLRQQVFQSELSAQE